MIPLEPVLLGEERAALWSEVVRNITDCLPVDPTEVRDVSERLRRVGHAWDAVPLPEILTPDSAAVRAVTTELEALVRETGAIRERLLNEHLRPRRP